LKFDIDITIIFFLKIVRSGCLYYMKLKFSTGINALDEVIQGVLPGDNIVFQVNDIKDYIIFVEKFCDYAKKNSQVLIYFRFADHSPIICQSSGLDNIITHYLDPKKGFEYFISEILSKIEEYGPGTCYIFDCLSDLAVDWYSDQMLANFFMLTCPYLYDFETVTYFALLKNHHSTETVKSIQNTAQVTLFIYNYLGKKYIHPIKVFERYTPSMYMLHVWDGDKIIPVNMSATISGILTEQTQPLLELTTQDNDLWSRTFKRAFHLEELPDNLKQQEEVKRIYKQLIRMAITRDEKLIKLVEKYFSFSNILNIGRRMIGTGLIGGKSVGMLLAQSIIERENPEIWNARIEKHDSFFIGSDVYYTFLVTNQCWWARRSIKTENDIPIARNLQREILKGKFDDKIVGQFKEMLDYFGQSPIIVRSSSLLEDAYGNSFSGKYESYFLVNQGDPEERLEKFMEAVRMVYASTLSRNALSYRAKRKIFNQDEQMAILIQRVSGAVYNEFFYPQIAGVGFSYNPFVWDKRIEPEAGMLRLVFGLGTRAVDRADDDYTRIVALNSPQLIPEGNGERSKYTQRRVDFLDISKNLLDSKYFEDIVNKNVENLLKIFLDRNEEFEQMMAQRGLEYKTFILTFDKLFENTSFIENMKDVLRTLESAYENHVDIEFTMNFIDGERMEDYKIDILQCRPFQFKDSLRSVDISENIDSKDIILKLDGPIIGQSTSTQIDHIIYIVPEKYGKMKMNERYSIARLIGNLNSYWNDIENEMTMLLGPGRWGTTSPSLGVPVSFSEINNMTIMGEIAEMHEFLIPDVSLGTHFFNDIVESDMLYFAIHPNHKDVFINKEFFHNITNELTNIIPSAQKYEEVVKVISIKNLDYEIRLDSNTFLQKAVCFKSNFNS
jgi:pyruvate,water dikinase